MSPPAQPVRTQPTRFDYIGQWLMDQHHLGAMDRSQVTQAVFVKPRALTDPRLKRAARDLAAEVLSGRLRLPRMQRYIGSIIIALGVALVLAGVVIQVVNHRGSLQLVVGGLVLIAGGAVTSVLAPRQMRGNVELAFRLNKEND